MKNNQERSLQMLSEALELEKKGEAFYKEAVSTCQNDLGREIFRMLMKDEGLHMDRILKIYNSLKAGQPWSEEWKSMKPDHKDLGVLFRKMASEHGTKITTNASDLDALNMGIDLEWRSIAFYKKNLTNAQGSIERDFIEQMIGEENGHHAVLSDMKLYLADPTGWFFEHEHTGLDGV
ncbi:MAG: ferritin family protein [Deltaproteobacteria bacterium]|nr:ferritin family protein [Deltaproteobacteria bacterium]